LSQSHVPDPELPPPGLEEASRATSKPQRRFVSREVLLEAFRHAPQIDVARFRADLDAQLDQDAEPRARRVRE